MVFYKTIPAVIKIKMIHIKKIGGRLYNSIIYDYGEIPGMCYNEITKKFEEVVNHRGNSYATRNRLKFRNKKIYKRR